MKNATKIHYYMLKICRVLLQGVAETNRQQKVFPAKEIASEHPNISHKRLWICSSLTLDTIEILSVITATSSEYSNLKFCF